MNLAAAAVKRDAAQVELSRIFLDPENTKMKITRLVGALCLALMSAAFCSSADAQGVSPNQMFACNQSAKYDASTNGATKLVTGNTAKGIYVCGWNILSGGTASVQFVYGTQVTNPCDTGQTAITPAFQLTAQVSEIDHLPVYTGATPVPTGKDVCILTNAGVAVQAILYFTQF